MTGLASSREHIWSTCSRAVASSAAVVVTWKYRPDRTFEYRETYWENVLYADRYLEMKSDS